MCVCWGTVRSLCWCVFVCWGTVRSPWHVRVEVHWWSGLVFALIGQCRLCSDWSVSICLEPQCRMSATWWSIFITAQLNPVIIPNGNTVIVAYGNINILLQYLPGSIDYIKHKDAIKTRLCRWREEKYWLYLEISLLHLCYTQMIFWHCCLCKTTFTYNHITNKSEMQYILLMYQIVTCIC